MSRIIKCQVNDEYLLGSGVVIGAAGSLGDVILQLQFNEMWDGLSIIATFRDAINERAEAVMLMPGDLVDGEVRTYQVHIPDNAKRIAGRARLTLSGYSVYTINDNGTVTPNMDSLTNTTTAFFRVLESDSAILDDGSITDATFAQQAQAEINRAAEAIASAEDAIAKAQEMLVDFDEAENGVFDSESNLITPGRVQNEEARVEAEVARKTKENTRLSKEAECVQSEKTRQDNESRRERNEVTRSENEESRSQKIAALEDRINGIDTILDAIINIQNTLIEGGGA
jgi:hypothetical protein